MGDVLTQIGTLLPFAVMVLFAVTLYQSMNRWTKRMSDPSRWSSLLFRWTSPARILLVIAAVVLLGLVLSRRYLAGTILFVPLIFLSRNLRAQRARACPNCSAPVPPAADRCARCGTPVAAS